MNWKVKYSHDLVHGTLLECETLAGATVRLAKRASVALSLTADSHWVLHLVPQLTAIGYCGM